MIEAVIELLRTARVLLYRLSNAVVFGIEVDIVLHFGFGALIFAIAQPRLGTRRAAWVLGSLTLAKEIADLFLKSRVAYIAWPDADGVWDLMIDVATSLAGGLAVWLVNRERNRWRRTY